MAVLLKILRIAAQQIRLDKEWNDEMFLGLEGDALVDVLNVKCDPILIGSLRTQPGFHPAYHMNKDKWISIRLDGTAPADEIKSLIAMSYEFTGLKIKRK